MLIDGGDDSKIYDDILWVSDTAVTFTYECDTWTDEDKTRQVLDRLEVKDIENYLRRKKLENLKNEYNL